MAVDPEALINYQIATMQDMIDVARTAIENVTFKEGARGYSIFDLGDAQLNAVYSRPDKDETPYPSYDVTIKVPDAPDLVTIHSIDAPNIPTQPVLNVDGLYAKDAPSITIPEWTETDPTLHVDVFLSEIQAISAPIIKDIALPDITPFTAGAVPELRLPDYEAPARPDSMDAPQDYAGYFEARYTKAQEAIKTFADSQVKQWLSDYAPNYHTMRATLDERVSAGLDGGILPDKFEQALIDRAAYRENLIFERAEADMRNNPNVRGHVIPPGFIDGAIKKARLVSASTVGVNANEAFIERQRMEIQHLQFTMGMADNMLATLRQAAIQFYQFALSVSSTAITYASELVGELKAMFDHQLAIRNFQLALTDAIGRELDVRLKVALQGLEKYKLELEAAKVHADIDSKQIESARLLVEQQDQKIRQYTALIGAVKDKAFIDELQIQKLDAMGRVFDRKISAVNASYGAFDSYLKGQDGKLKGELGKQEGYQNTLKSIEIGVDIQKAIQESDAKLNAARMAQYSGKLEGVDIAARVALQKFTSQATLKELGLKTYGIESEIAGRVYEIDYRKQSTALEAKLKAFGYNSQNQQEYFRLDQKYAEMSLSAQEYVAGASSNMAGSLANATNATISVAQ